MDVGRGLDLRPLPHMVRLRLMGEVLMDIGKEKEKITVEPIVNPVPRREPAPAPDPVKQPKEPVKV